MCNQAHVPECMILTSLFLTVLFCYFHLMYQTMISETFFGLIKAHILRHIVHLRNVFHSIHSDFLSWRHAAYSLTDIRYLFFEPSKIIEITSEPIESFLLTMFTLPYICLRIRVLWHHLGKCLRWQTLVYTPILVFLLSWFPGTLSGSFVADTIFLS